MIALPLEPLRVDHFRAIKGGHNYSSGLKRMVEPPLYPGVCGATFEPLRVVITILATKEDGQISLCYVERGTFL